MVVFSGVGSCFSAILTRSIVSFFVAAGFKGHAVQRVVETTSKFASMMLGDDKVRMTA
jgi:hypothetical protein